MRPAEEIKRLFRESKVNVSSQTDDMILADMLAEMDKSSCRRKPGVWRIIMTSPITKLSTAAVIVAAAIIGAVVFFGPGATSIAFATVIEPIMNAKTAEFDIVIGTEEKSTVIHDMVSGSRIRRTVAPFPNVTIIDLATSKVLSLEPHSKKAFYIELANLPKFDNYLQHLRDVISRLQDKPDFAIKELGETEIDGRRVIEFVAEGPQTKITIWADIETHLPVRIDSEENQMKVICKNFRFDEPMDESLFSMEIPEGYTQEQMAIDFSAASEEEFIEGLRIMAEYVGNGFFLEDVSVEYYVKNIMMIDGKFRESGIDDQEEKALMAKWTRHLMFLRFYKGQGRWYYAGAGVKLGDAETPIFWYQPAESKTWRVIYGDLHVEDVAAGNLPNLEDVRKKVSQEGPVRGYTAGQDDTWHIAKGGNITAHSSVSFAVLPKDGTFIPIELPYSDATLNSAVLGERQITFAQTAPGKYELRLPVRDNISSAELECTWTITLDSLKKVDYGYRTVLNALVPVTSYKLEVVLEDGCGFENAQAPDQRTLVPFSTSGAPSARRSFGSCGITIRQVEQ